MKLPVTVNTESKSSLLQNELELKAPDYGLVLRHEARDALVKYYELLEAWNARLHLVAPCSPQEFATRHLLESLLLLQFLPQGARVADVGSGAGLPILPCLIVRADLHAVLIEASPKKAVFLREALIHTGISNRASVVVDRFENTSRPDAGFVSCRALERFSAMLPTLVAWAPTARYLLFGGSSLQENLEQLGLTFETNLIVGSEKRFLYVARKPGK